MSNDRGLDIERPRACRQRDPRSPSGASLVSDHGEKPDPTGASAGLTYLELDATELGHTQALRDPHEHPFLDDFFELLAACLERIRVREDSLQTGDLSVERSSSSLS